MFLIDALKTTGSMTWQIAWSLIFGFTLSSTVQAVVRRETISRMLGDDRPATQLKASGLGAASSSPEVSAGHGHTHPSGRVDDRAHLSVHSQQHAAPADRNGESNS